MDRCSLRTCVKSSHSMQLDCQQTNNTRANYVHQQYYSWLALKLTQCNFIVSLQNVFFQLSGTSILQNYLIINGENIEIKKHWQPCFGAGGNLLSLKSSKKLARYKCTSLTVCKCALKLDKLSWCSLQVWESVAALIIVHLCGSQQNNSQKLYCVEKKP